MTECTSIVVLSFDQLRYTQGCLASLGEHTPEAHEVVVVDNGSAPEVAAWVREHADAAVLNPDNRGVAAALNQGARAASGDVLASATTRPASLRAGWRRCTRRCAPATMSGWSRPPSRPAPRSTAGERRGPRCASWRRSRTTSPPACVWPCVGRRSRPLAAGTRPGALVASEDFELGFALWALGYRVLIDERVLVEHACEGTSAAKLADWKATYTEAGRRFLERWRAGAAPVGARFPGGPWRAAQRARWRPATCNGARAALAAAEAAALRDRRAESARGRRPHGPPRPEAPALALVRLNPG